MASGTSPLSDVFRNNILVNIRAGQNHPRATFTRADSTTCATAWLNTGLLSTVAAGILRIEWVDLDSDGIRETPGYLIEGARTNVVLRNRDLTNVAWTQTNCTPVKDQLGIDGVTNGGCRITATAGNATCLQAIVLASSARYQSAYVKRLVGSGVVEMTMDNGATWTAIVVTSTTTWTRVTIPTQTLANPTVGFRIVTSADSIAVDYVQNENGMFPSSPIATTGGAITRSADSLTIPFNFSPMDFTVLARIARPPWADIAGTLVIFPGVYDFSNHTTPKLRLYQQSTTRNFTADIDTAGADSSVSGATPAGTSITIAAQYKNLTTSGQVAIDVGSGMSGFATAAAAIPAFGSQTLNIGTVLTTDRLFGVLTHVLAVRGLKTRQDMMQLAGIL